MSAKKEKGRMQMVYEWDGDRLCRDVARQTPADGARLVIVRPKIRLVRLAIWGLRRTIGSLMKTRDVDIQLMCCFKTGIMPSICYSLS